MNPEMLAQIFGVLAAVVIGCAYARYYWQLRHGESVPNPATWMVWLIVGVINMFNYTMITRDLLKSCMTIPMVILMCLIIHYAWTHKRIGALNILEKVTIALSGVVIIAWVSTGSKEVAAVILEVIYMISYVPTVLGLWRRTASEGPASWGIAIAAYALQTLAVLVNFDNNYFALLFPMINGLLGNGCVLALIYWQRWTKAESA